MICDRFTVSHVRIHEHRRAHALECVVNALHVFDVIFDKILDMIVMKSF